jgi:O-antigen ligase
MSFNTSITRPSLITREFLFIRLFQLCVFTIPISSFVSVRLLLITAIFSVFLGKSFSNIWIQAFDLFIYLFILVIGLLYSQDLISAFKVLETNFSFLAIPLILSRLSPFNIEVRDKIFQSFLFGVTAASLTCLSFAAYRYIIEPDIQFFFFETFTEIIKSHPTYLAYYIIFSITVELFNLYHGKYLQRIVLRYLVIFFLFLILILTGGQTAFISMLIVFSFFILKFLTEKSNKNRKIVVASVVMMLAFMFFATLMEKTNRLSELNDSWERANLWKSAIAANSNILWGVGTGDYKVALNDYYRTHGMTGYAVESYNAHNQFIQFLFSNGIIGLLSLILMIGRPLFLGLKTNNVLAILCIFPFLIYGITEVFLGRFQGVVFFAFLHQVFIAEMKSNVLVNNTKMQSELNVGPI